jgi:single-strand DNA-binding protein
MSLQINDVRLAGILGRDPEIRYTTSGMAVVNASMACSRRYKAQNATEWKEETTWVDLEIWGKRAESFSELLGKGVPVYIEGHLKKDEWEDKNTGQKRTKMKIVVDKWQFVERKSKSGGGAPRSSGASSRSSGEDRRDPGPVSGSSYGQGSRSRDDEDGLF